MDDIRRERQPATNWVAQTTSPANTVPAEATEAMDPPSVVGAAFKGLNALADEFIMYRDRVAELDRRLNDRTAERDGARRRAEEFDNDRHTEQRRADNLQRSVDWYQDQRRKDLETLGETSKELATVREILARVAKERDAASGKVVAARAGLEAEDRTVNTALDRIERLTRERDEALAQRDEERAGRRLAQRERDQRFTARQVGDAQASEAELVSKPLRTRIASLEAGLAKEMKANMTLAEQAAEELSARRETERQLHEAHQSHVALRRRADELQAWLDCREDRQRRAQDEAHRLRTTLDQIKPAITKIADTVASEAVGHAIDPENPDYNTEPSNTAIRDAVRQVRHEIRKAYGRIPQAPVSDWDGPTCGAQCRHEGSPGSPTE